MHTLFLHPTSNCKGGTMGLWCPLPPCGYAPRNTYIPGATKRGRLAYRSHYASDRLRPSFFLFFPVSLLCSYFISPLLPFLRLSFCISVNFSIPPLSSGCLLVALASYCHSMFLCSVCFCFDLCSFHCMQFIRLVVCDYCAY